MVLFTLHLRSQEIKLVPLVVAVLLALAQAVVDLGNSSLPAPMADHR